MKFQLAEFEMSPAEATTRVTADNPPFRALITSARTYTDYQQVWKVLWFTLGGAVAVRRSLTVVHGHCGQGGDQFADEWATAAEEAGFPVTIERHPAQNHPTEDFGPWPGAGPRRNRYMASLGAQMCLAFTMPCTKPSCRRPAPHDTHGTTSCTGYARMFDIPVKEFPGHPAARPFEGEL